MTKYQTKNKVTNTISPKKDFRKLNGFDIAFTFAITPINGLCYTVINLSNQRC